MRLDTSHCGFLPSALFAQCLHRIKDDKVTKMISGYCTDSEDRAHLERLSQLIEDFLYTPLDTAFALGRTATFAIGTSGNEEKLESADLLKKDIISKLNQRTSGLFAGFKFFDVRQSGVLSVSDVMQGLVRLGIRTDAQVLETLINRVSVRAELTLEGFCELFREGIASLSPSPRPQPLPELEETKTYRKRQLLPSDKDPKHSYGKGNQPTDSIKDVLAYSYQREWILQKLQKDQSRSLSPAPRRKFYTKTTRLRLQQLAPSPLRPHKLPSLSSS